MSNIGVSKSTSMYETSIVHSAENMRDVLVASPDIVVPNFEELWSFIASEYADQSLADGVALNVTGGKLVPTIAATSSMDIDSGVLRGSSSVSGIEKLGFYGTDADDAAFAAATGAAYAAFVDGDIILGETSYHGAALATAIGAASYSYTGARMLSNVFSAWNTASGDSPIISTNPVSGSFGVIVVQRPEGRAIFGLEVGGTWTLLWLDEIKDWTGVSDIYPGLYVSSDLSLSGLLAQSKLVQLDTSRALYPVPQLSDGFGTVPTLTDQGDLGIDATPVKVGLSSDSMYFNGVDSYAQLPSSLLTNWSHSTGSIVFEFTPTKADIGATGGYVVHIGHDGDNRVRISQYSNYLYIAYRASATTEQATIGVVAPHTTYRVGAMWANGSITFYLDGVQLELTQTIEGEYSGDLVDAYCQIGARQGMQKFSGYISDAIISTGVAPSHTDMLWLTDQANTLTKAELDSRIGASKYMWLNSDSGEYLSDGKGHVEGTETPTVGSSIGDGVQHLGPTWSVAGGVAYNAPVAGAELLINGDFADWTADDPDGWMVAGESGSDPEVSEVDSGQGHGGTNVTGGNVNIYTSDGTAVFIYQSRASLNNWFVASISIDSVIAGSLKLQSGGISIINSITTDTTVVYRATSFDFRITRMGDATDITVSNASLKQLQLSDFISSVEEIAYPLMYTEPSVDRGYPTGLCVQIDNPINPLSGQLAYLDNQRANVVIEDLATATILSTTAITYSDGARFMLRLDDDGNLWAWYNGALVVTQAVTLNASNTYCGLFDTGSPSGCTSNFAVYDSKAVDMSEVLN